MGARCHDLKGKRTPGCHRRGPERHRAASPHPSSRSPRDRRRRQLHAQWASNSRFFRPIAPVDLPSDVLLPAPFPAVDRSEYKKRLKAAQNAKAKRRRRLPRLPRPPPSPPRRNPRRSRRVSSTRRSTPQTGSTRSCSARLRASTRTRTSSTSTRSSPSSSSSSRPPSRTGRLKRTSSSPSPAA